MSQALSVLQSLTFEQPGVLWLIALAVPLVLVAVRARLRATRMGLRVAVIAMRLCMLGLLVLALAEPRVRPAGHARAVVFAIDVSDSVSPNQQAWARAWVASAIRALPPGSRSDTIEFAARAQLAGSADAPAGETTDLSAALKLAGALVPRDASAAPEIVLLTDGWPSTADATSPADALPAGVAVSYVPLPIGPEQPVAVVHSLSVPGIARQGDRLDVTLDLQATEPVDVQLRLWLDQTLAVDGPVHLEAGETRLSLPQAAAAPGFLTVRAEVQAGLTPSTLSSVVVVKPPARVLVLEDNPVQADALLGVLQSQGLQVERRPAASVPPSASALLAFDAAVLVNTPATSLSLDQLRTLQSFVQDFGRGLLVVGGDRSFAPGGYQSTPLDDMLPVSAEPPIEPQQGSLALFLVIDRSGSMDMLTGGGPTTGGASKIAMAREAAIEAAGLLQPQDTLGVISFDSAFQWVVPPTKLDSPEAVARAQSLIGTIKPGGGTTILPPLEAAFKAAARTDAPLRHIVLLTDGESNDRGYEDLVARMQAAQVTLSTLAIGSDADTRLLSNLAHIGGGRYYFTERGSQIPRIASKETTILTRNAVVEGKIAAIVAEPSPILRSLPGDLPPLSAYVATTRKDRAVTALETARGHPLLAHWQYGLGRVAAWTSEVQQGWASAWSEWRGAAQFWSQTVRWTLPAPVGADFQPSAVVRADGRQVVLSAQAVADDGRFADGQDTRATVVTPDGSARELSVPQSGPGTYSLDTRVSDPGVYRVLFSQGAREELAGFSAPDSPELHSVGLNRSLLDALARASGGHAITDIADVARPANGASPAIDLWPYLLLAALLLLPVDVFMRRRA